MKFKINDQTLRIDFQREQIGKSVKTTAHIKNEDNVPLLTGTASVDISKYNACKETGRKIALTRAIKDHFHKDIRRVIWQAYFSRKTNNQLINNVLQNV
jgi:hypothetical protein